MMKSTFLTSSKHVLRFGSLDWKGEPAEGGYQMKALAQGADFGSPGPIEQIMAHALLYGSISGYKGFENRSASFDVVIRAEDSIALGNGCAALELECAKPRTLTFTPPDGLGATTVFEVDTADPAFQFDTNDELNLRRRYRMTIKCLPFGKSDHSIEDSVDPVASPAAEQLVNACDVITGFVGLDGSTASIDTTVKYQGTGSVKLTGQQRVPVETDYGTRPRETGTLGLSGLTLGTPATRPYMSFDGYVGNSGDFSATLETNGEAASFVSATRLDAEWVRFMFRTGVTATTEDLKASLTITGSFGVYYNAVEDTWLNVPSSWAPRIDNILRSGTPSSMARQSLRSVTIHGTAPSEGSLAISHPTDGLGKVLALTSPALSTGFTPDLMKHCTVTTTTDSTSVSGKVKAFGNALVPFEFPAALIPPGSYQLMGVMQTGTLGDPSGGGPLIRVDMSTKAGSVTLSTDQHIAPIESTGYPSAEFDVVDCGSITLPTSNVPAGSGATVRLEIVAIRKDFYEDDPDTTASWGASFQEFFLIPLSTGTSVSIIDCGTGPAAVGESNNRLWLDAATPPAPRPSAWLGTEEDRTDAYHAVGASVRWQRVPLQPGEMLLYLANTGAANATATLTHTPAWRAGFAAE